MGSRQVPGPLVLLLCALLQSAAARAQPQADEGPLQLKLSPQLQALSPIAPKHDQPTFLSADQITGRPELETVLEGNAELRRGETMVRAGRLEYFQPEDRLKASGNVRINHAGNVYEGEQLDLKVDTFEGSFIGPRYHLLANDAHGQADRIEFLDDKRAVIRNASYTTCKRDPAADWVPDWLLRAGAIRLDREDEVAVAEDASLDFKGATLMNLPYVSFALTDKRKSGVLAPTFGVDSISGTEVTVPYYWDIAPNRDATLYPTLMTSRGVNWGGEFRYLEPSYTGRLRADYMPDDKLRGQTRWGVAYKHQAAIDTGMQTGRLGLNVNLNRVSDDDYWRDFPRGTTSQTQRLLANDVSLNWSRENYSATLRTLKWQTLQDVTAPIVPPYDRWPQLALHYLRLDAGGFDFSADGDYTQFRADPRLTGQPNAQRSYASMQLSRPWIGAAGFITPKLLLHSRSYQFDTPLATGESTATSTVPTFSLDSGLIFERATNYLGRDFLQTLEPRLYYVNTPYRDQNYLPNYDSGANDFNFASIYTENAFVGNDRIADNKLWTAGVTTRLLDPATGGEAARFGMAQRFRFADQNVTLPGGTPAPQGLSDILLGAALNLDSRWLFDTTVQFNPTTEKSIRSTAALRYNPGHYRVVNMAYRFQRDISELLDVGWQWPINDLWGDKGMDLGPGAGQGPGRWYSVGRLNYSLQEGKLVDSILGFEYDAGCWLGRVVLERLQTGLATANQRIMFQLEFVGFSRLGIDPLSTLKNNIPRYEYLREQVSAPSYFSNYD
jgi:LPS-assembly protein